jgi:hypothetical protein
MKEIVQIFVVRQLESDREDPLPLFYFFQAAKADTGDDK